MGAQQAGIKKGRFGEFIFECKSDLSPVGGNCKVRNVESVVQPESQVAEGSVTI